MPVIWQRTFSQAALKRGATVEVMPLPDRSKVLDVDVLGTMPVIFVRVPDPAAETVDFRFVVLDTDEPYHRPLTYLGSYRVGERFRHVFQVMGDEPPEAARIARKSAHAPA